MVLIFIDTDGDGSTEPVYLYLSLSPENYSNVSICPGVFIHVIIRYLNVCNKIENSTGCVSMKHL